MKNNRILLLILALVLLAVCCCTALATGLILLRTMQRGTDWATSSNREVSETSISTLPAGEPAALEVNVPVGDITLRGGEAGQVTVEVTKRVWARTEAEARNILEAMQVEIEPVEGGVRINVPDGVWSEQRALLPRTPQVDLVVTVPVETSLQVEMGVGRLEVIGIRGDMRIQADVGEVSLRDVTPLATLEVTSRVASVQLEGPLAGTAAYDLTSDIGRIHLSLPQDSAFEIDARSDVGNVTLGFDLQGRSSREGFVGKEVIGQVGADPVGPDPGARLTLRSRVGDIVVQPVGEPAD